MPDTSVTRVPFGARWIWLGILSEGNSKPSIIWMSPFGDDPEPVTGWPTAGRAREILDAYLADAAMGTDPLLVAIRASQVETDQIAPAPLTTAQRALIVEAIAHSGE